MPRSAQLLLLTPKALSVKMRGSVSAGVPKRRPAANLNATRKRRGPKGGGQDGPTSSSSRITCDEVAATKQERISEGYPSGQRGQTVNLLAYAFGGSNPPPSTKMRSTGCFMEVELNHPMRYRFDKLAGASLNSPQGWPRRGGGQDARSHPPPSTIQRTDDRKQSGVVRPEAGESIKVPQNS